MYLKNDDRENLSKNIYIFNLKFNRRLSLPIKFSFLDIFQMEATKPYSSGHIIKARKLKDGFTFKLSMDHIIEQVNIAL